MGSRGERDLLTIDNGQGESANVSSIEEKREQDRREGVECFRMNRKDGRRLANEGRGYEGWVDLGGR